MAGSRLVHDVGREILFTIANCFVDIASHMYREKVMAAAKGEGDGLEFDKDDQIAMNFVAAASNLRGRVFQVR